MTPVPLSPPERSQVYHALSDETRLAIVEALRGGERCVCDLQTGLDAAQSRLSFHLKVLRDAGLVRDRKEGRWSYYTLVPERFEAAAVALGDMARPAARKSPKLHQLTRTRADTAGARMRGARMVRPASSEEAGKCCG